MTPPTSSSTFALPPLTAEEAEQSARVVAAVGAAVDAAGGWLPFDDYLRTALYAPGLGYYSAGTTKFGVAGDFITAPELSPLFAACVARQAAQVLQAVRAGGGAPCILELGAGSGVLAGQLLTALAAVDGLPERYFILEVSAELRARQRVHLEQLPSSITERVSWLPALPREPFDGLIVANEVADALPFKRFHTAADGPREIGVAIGGGALVLAERPAGSALAAELERVFGGTLPADYASEICLLLDGWIAALGAALRRGAVLLFDYGLSRREYYHAQRLRGTLRCHFRHRAHDDALSHPGLTDITAWVDFTRAAEAAADADLTVGGYCTQAAFLLATGIESLLAADSSTERARLASQARQLLLPGEMGEVFKALVLTRGLDQTLMGFSLQDLRRQL